MEMEVDMFGYKPSEADDGLPSQELLDALDRVWGKPAMPGINDGLSFANGYATGSSPSLGDPYLPAVNGRDFGSVFGLPQDDMMITG